MDKQCKDRYRLMCSGCEFEDVSDKLFACAVSRIYYELRELKMNLPLIGKTVGAFNCPLFLYKERGADNGTD